MTIRTKAELKLLFETGDQPSAQDFIDLIDSFLDANNANWPDPLPASSAANLTNVGDALPDPLPARDGSALTGVNVGEWQTITPAAGYVDPTHCIVDGNQASVYTDTRRMRFTVGGPATHYTEVVSTSYDGPSDKTTIEVADAFPNTTISAHAVSAFQPTANGGALSLNMLTANPLSLANGGTGSNNASGARVNLALGTAAVLNVGTAAANVPQLANDADTNPSLPAVSALNLTSLPLMARDGVLCPHDNLTITRTSATQVDIDADVLQLTNANGAAVQVSSVNLTVAITGSGANGLDTGAEANSTWYHLWVIYNGTTVAGLLSASATAPTMPSGYTFKGYVGAIYNDGSGDLIELSQRNRSAVRKGALFLTTGGSTSVVSVSYAAYAPPTATEICVNMQLASGDVSAGTGYCHPVTYSAGADAMGHCHIPGRDTGAPAGSVTNFVIMPQIETGTCYYNVIGAPDDLDLSMKGWRF